jgi:Asp-tRNA(Asn)/Glu-tRNA(Gln) amidotransferase B subunit
MLQKIKDILQKYRSAKAKARHDKIFERNRNCFESIHSDKGSGLIRPGLKSIYQRLHADDNTLTDNEILYTYKQFSKSVQTNSFSAADLHLVSISTICYFRPNLTEELIKESLRAILHSLGDIDYAIIKQYIDERIINKEVESYGGLPDNEGIEWLTKIIINQNDLIKKVIADVIEQNDKELDQLRSGNAL